MGLFPAMVGEGPGGGPAAYLHSRPCSNDRRDLEGVSGVSGDPSQSLNFLSSLEHRGPFTSQQPTPYLPVPPFLLPWAHPLSGPQSWGDQPDTLSPS